MWCNVGWDGGGDGGCKVWGERERNEREAGWSRPEQGGGSSGLCPDLDGLNQDGHGKGNYLCGYLVWS